MLILDENDSTGELNANGNDSPNHHSSHGYSNSSRLAHFSINARVVFAVRERTGNERVHLSTNPDAEQQRHYSRTVDRILASLGALDLLPFDKTSAAIDKCSLDQLQKITKSKETSVRESQWGQLSLNNNNNNSREENTPPTPVPETLPNSPGTPYLTSHTRTQWMLANVSDRDASPSPLGMDTETNSRGQIDVDYMEAGKGGNDDNSAVKCQWEARLRRRGCSTFVRTGDCDSILSEQALARHYLQHAMTQIRTYYTMTCPVKDCEMLLFQRTEDETSEDVISKHNSLMHRTIPSSRRKASTSTPSTTKDMSSKRYRSPGSKSAISNTAIGVSKQPRRQKSRSKTKEPSLTKETPLTTRRGVVMSRMTAETVEDSCESDVNEVEGLGGVSAKRRANQDHESQSHRRKTRNTFGNDQETPDLRIKSENTS